MTKRLRVIAIVIGLLAMCGGTVSAYSEDSSLNVTIIEGTDEFTATLDEPVSVEELLELQEIDFSEDDEPVSYTHLLVCGKRLSVQNGRKPVVIRLTASFSFPSVFQSSSLKHVYIYSGTPIFSPLRYLTMASFTSPTTPGMSSM